MSHVTARSPHFLRGKREAIWQEVLSALPTNPRPARGSEELITCASHPAGPSHSNRGTQPYPQGPSIRFTQLGYTHYVCGPYLAHSRHSIHVYWMAGGWRDEEHSTWPLAALPLVAYKRLAVLTCIPFLQKLIVEYFKIS